MATNKIKEISPPKTNWILGGNFQKRMPHHDGIRALWETKWKFPCTISVYPFHDGKFEDFEPVFDYLIKNDINDGYGDAYTEAFFATAEALTKQADASTDTEVASSLYLRAACLYRISRFPHITSFPSVSSASKWKAWEAQKNVYMKASSKWPIPILEVEIPFTEREGRDRESIPVYLRVPKTTNGGKAPCVLLFTGLDGYRPDNTQRSDEFLRRGWGSLIVEVPGTADCPADPFDALSTDRLWSSIFTWMETSGIFDMSRLLVWGLSTGGYYAARIAHTHRERLRGCVAQGAGTHWFFKREWLVKAGGHEYPFALEPAIARKHGYEDFEKYMDEAAGKFSLLETGILEMPSTRLLFINGVDDGLMPIEDSMLPFEYGTPKEGRFFQKALHMGYPAANASVYPWMEQLMA